MGPDAKRRAWRALAGAAALGLGAVAHVAAAADAPDFAVNRSRMIETIVAETRLTGEWIGKTKLDPRVLAVMARVPRHEFVPPALAPFAYLDRPLPIGFGQTVSQPYIVALMTDLARIRPGDDVLLLGAGGGYHAAIIAELAGRVKIVDMQPEVAAAALNRLARLGYANVEVRTSDPYFGWRGASQAFDAIIARQAADFIPEALVRQLRPGGRIVAPVGAARDEQSLVVAEKTKDGQMVERKVMPVRFTRLPGGPRI